MTSVPWLLLLPLSSYAGVFPYEIQSKVLDNGLEIHVVEMNSNQVVAYYTWMDVGSRDEVEEGRTGFAHFFEHLMFYDTEALSREERERELLTLGVDDNAWTWLDETVYHSVISTAHLERLIEIEADRFQDLRLTEEMVRKEAGAVYGEFRKSQADPDERLTDVLYHTAFSAHTYGHSTLGLEADIAVMPTSVDYAARFFERHYTPKKATILVVGDVRSEDVFDTIQAAYSGWQAPALEDLEIPAEPAQVAPRQQTVVWPSPTAARLALGWKIPGHDPDNPEIAALQLLEDLLLASVGPLQRRLVEGRLAYEVSGGRDSFVDPGLFRVVVTVRDPKDLAQVQAIIEEEISAAQRAIDAGRLASTRSHARYRILRRLDSPQAVASTLGWHLRRGGTPDALDRFYAQYDAVTAEQVSAAARKYLVASQQTTVTLLPPPDSSASPDPVVNPIPQVR